MDFVETLWKVAFTDYCLCDFSGAKVIQPIGEDLKEKIFQFLSHVTLCESLPVPTTGNRIINGEPSVRDLELAQYCFDMVV